MVNMSAPSRWRAAWAALARWWRSGTEGSANELAAEDLERMARDLGVSACDLRSLLHRPAQDARLLRQRMELLGITPEDVSSIEAAMLRDMQRVCTMCDSRGVCIRDLRRSASDPHSQDWRDYCPNAATLNMISTLKVCTRTPAKVEKAR